jgi:hypothetical protein
LDYLWRASRGEILVRMCVAAASRLAELAGRDRAEMGPSYIVLLGVVSSVLLIGATLLRGLFHWLVSVVGR